MSELENQHLKQTYKHTTADNVASAKADTAFEQGKWQEFTGQELAPEAAKKGGYPDFYILSGEQRALDQEQLAEANESFNVLFDDRMLRGMKDIRRFESIKGRPKATLSMRARINDQTYSVSFGDKGVRSSEMVSHGIEFRDSETFTRDISLQRIDEEGYGREYWSYRLGADGTVRRWDGGDVIEKKRKEREAGIEEPRMLEVGSTLEDIGKAALIGIKGITERLPNSRLEEDMGLNNQPVAQDEIDGLQAFLSEATLIPR